MSDLQLPSWCDPFGSRRVEGLVGQIYFPTDGSELDGQDRAELAKLRSEFSTILLGRRVHFWCVGHADERARMTYNRDLAQRRADVVKRHLDSFFHGARNYSAAGSYSRGELEAHFPVPSQQQMASDRRVDVFTSLLRQRPPLQLDLISILGRRPPTVSIQEVHSGETDPNAWSPASRTDESVGTSRGDRISLIPRGLQYVNQITVEANIRARLEEIRPIVAFRLMDHARGGVLIVAEIDVTEHSGATVGIVRQVYDYPGVFNRPNDAIGRWRREPLLVAPMSRDFGRMEYRFFWATRR